MDDGQEQGQKSAVRGENRRRAPDEVCHAAQFSFRPRWNAWLKLWNSQFSTQTLEVVDYARQQLDCSSGCPGIKEEALFVLLERLNERELQTRTRHATLRRGTRLCPCWTHDPAPKNTRPSKVIQEKVELVVILYSSMRAMVSTRLDATRGVRCDQIT